MVVLHTNVLSILTGVVISKIAIIRDILEIETIIELVTTNLVPTTMVELRVSGSTMIIDIEVVNAKVLEEEAEATIRNRIMNITKDIKISPVINTKFQKEVVKINNKNSK